MNKFIKYGLLSAGGAAVLVAGGLTYIAATFNPNDYKAQIIQAVKDKKQRNLKLDGDIKLTFFPSIGANIGKVSLSEFKNEKEFAKVDSAHVSLALLPLLSRQVLVDEVAVSGLKAHLVKFKGGKTNIDDLLGKDENKPSGGVQVKFDIASVHLEKTELTYSDETTGAKYALKDINLKTGRIANGVPAKIDFAALIQANRPKLDVSVQLQTTLTFDLEKNRYQAEGLDLQAKGGVLDISDLLLKAGGNASANLATQEYSAKSLAVSATGMKGKDNFEAKLDAPALNLSKNKFSGDKLTFNARLDGAMGNIVANLSLPGLEGNAQSFKSSALALDVDVKQPEQAFKVKLSSPVYGNFEVQQFNLSSLTVAVNATGDKLPNKSISSEMKGSIQVDVGRQSVNASLAGGLLQSQVKAKVAVNDFSNPAIRFDVDMDQLDADLYIPKQAEGDAGKKAAAPEQPFDLSALKKLNLEGSLRIGTLKVANVKSSQVRIDIKARNGVANISPLSAKLYQGSMNGSITVNAAQATPGFAVNQSLSGINIAPLLKDAANFDTLEGKGNVTLNLTTQGNTVSTLKKALNGSMALNLADGAIKGINVAKKLREFGKSSTSAQTQAADKAEKTDFSELKASFRVNNGVAHNDDLSMKSPLLRLAGNGDINIGNDSINYVAKATLAKTLEGQGGKDNVGGITVPVRLSGPFTDLKYTLDFGAMVSDAAKQKIEAKKEEVKTKLNEQLKGGLKSLFK
ncbi:MAG: AsmA family protein [Gallionellaceae bacterium]|nr:AsmA family protein [Gallionellaceae bacterium]